MDELIDRLELILVDEYSCSQLKAWLSVSASCSDSVTIDRIIDELENNAITIEDAADSLSCFLA